MNCEVCNEEEAAWTLIPIGEGMPQSLGNACLARFGLAAAKAILPAEEIAATLGPLFVTPAREDLHEDAQAERAKRGRKSKAKATAPQGETGGAAEAPATGTDE